MLTIFAIVFTFLIYHGEADQNKDCLDMYGSFFNCNENECIDSAWVCDGDNDCDNGLDEVDCYLKVCAEYKFQCTNGLCIYAEEQCDGFADCDDGIDEENCTEMYSIGQSRKDKTSHLRPDFCNQDPDTGTCTDLNYRYYFNKTTERCELFFYGGCEGNENNFFKQRQCEAACSG